MEIKQKIIDAALVLAVEQGWENLTLRDIALRASVSLPDLYDEVDDKNDILVLIGRMIDRKVIEGVALDADDALSTRDRLFDLMMDRYEVLNEYRGGLNAILESFKYDPKQMVISLPYLCRSMSWMLEASGADTSGVKGAIKVLGLTGVYLKVLKIWAEDESVDLSKTMSSLDKALERSESIADTLGF